MQTNAENIPVPIVVPMDEKRDELDDGMWLRRQHDDAKITYSVRELLDHIRLAQADGFARLEVNLAGKADKADLDRLEMRLDNHTQRLDHTDNRVNRIEDQQHDSELIANVHSSRDEYTWTTRRKILAGVASLAMILATFLGPYLATHL